MTTKTDFHAIQELREKYAPKVRGIVSGEEAKAIYEVLEIDKRNNIELQNIRDMVVMIYGQWFDKSRDQYLEDKKNGVQAVDKSAEYLDAMSAIICRGLPPRKVSHGERGIHGKDTKPGAGTAGR